MDKILLDRDVNEKRSNDLPLNNELVRSDETDSFLFGLFLFCLNGDCDCDLGNVFVIVVVVVVGGGGGGVGS